MAFTTLSHRLLLLKQIFICVFVVLISLLPLIFTNSFAYAAKNTDIKVYNEDGEAEKISLNKIKDDIFIHPFTDVQMVSEKSILPVTIENNTDYSLDMKLRVTTNTTKLDVSASDELKEINIGAHTQEKINVELISRANGNAKVNLILSTKNGKFVSKANADIHIFATVGLFLKICFFIFIGLLLVFGVYRTVKKHSQSNTDDLANDEA